MLTLTLQGLTSLDSVSFGPAPYYKISGENLLEGPTDSVLGHHCTGYWTVQGKFFTVYEITGVHFIHFTDGSARQSARYGPFEKTRVADGHLAAPGLTARYLEDKHYWNCGNDNTVWSEIVFTVL